MTHQRSLFLVGHTHGAGYIHNDDVRGAFRPPLTCALRKEDVAMSQFTPVLANFTEADVQAIEKERERERKRSKRNTRGRRGIVLPDREPLKTMRTLLHPTVDPNAGPPPEPTVAAPIVSSRRAAAIAAQANITVSLQDLPFPDRPPSPPAALHWRHAKKQSLPRFSRGASRASPSSTREGSVVNGDHTPSISLKRHLREDSEDAGSPLPPRKRHNGRVADSPDLDDMIKEERPGSRGSHKPATPIPVPISVKQWHCKNCGVPETLAGVKMKDMNGQLDLCAKCGNHLQRTGRKRNVEYNEDEEYHRLRVDSNPGSGDNSPAPFDILAISSPKRAAESDSSSSGSDSDSDDYEDAAERKRKKAKLAAAKAATKPISAGKKGTTPAPATPAAAPTTPGHPSANGPQPPAWAQQALVNMNQKYAGSRFVFTVKTRPPDQPQGDVQWRVKCPDCPGKIYTLGPGETLDNFEAHAKYRTHTANVQARISSQGS